MLSDPSSYIGMAIYMGYIIFTYIYKIIHIFFVISWVYKIW